MVETITDSGKYIAGLLSEIDRKKTVGGKAIYRINDKMTIKVSKDVKMYFSNKSEYNIEIRKCARCKNEYDIIIYF